MSSPVIVLPPTPDPRSRGLGVASLVLGILLVLGVALWMVVGGVFLALLVWIFPIVVVAAFVIGAVHLVVMTIALVLGILAIVKDRGRMAGIFGIVLTVIATAVTVLVAIFFAEIAGILLGGSAR